MSKKYHTIDYIHIVDYNWVVIYFLHLRYLLKERNLIENLILTSKVVNLNLINFKEIYLIYLITSGKGITIKINIFNNYLVTVQAIYQRTINQN